MVDLNHYKLLCLSVKGIIITICCPWSEQEKSLEGAIKEAFHDSKKVKITWFENGYLKVNPDDVIHFLTSYQSTQEPSVAANRPPQSVMSKESLPLPWNYKIYLSSGKTVFALTHIRRGIISDKTNQAEDVQYWKPDFVVPWEIVDRLRKKNCKTSDAELAILMTEGGNLSCQVGKRNAKEWKNYITLGLDEIVVLQTKLKEGKISFEEKDLVIRYDMWRVPQNEVDRLQKDYKETRTADLFITSDPKGNSRCIVKVGASSKMFTFINTLYNQAVGKISNLI